MINKKIFFISLIMLAFAAFSCGTAGDDYKKAGKLARSGNIEDLESSLKIYQKEINRKINAYDQTVALNKRIARLLIKREYFKEAIRYLETARETAPADYEISHLLGLCTANLARFNPSYASEAKRYYEQSIALRPESIESFYGLAMVYYMLEKDSAKAKELLMRAKQLSNNYTDAYIALAKIYFEDKDYQDAINEYRSLILLLPKKDPRKGTYYVNMGVIYEQLGDGASAASAFREAYGINKKDPVVAGYYEKYRK